MKTIITGSRTGVTLDDIVWAVKNCGWEITHVVTGGPKGVGQVAEAIADILGVPTTVLPPQFGKYGKSQAVRMQTEEMADNAEALIAVWNETSKGTFRMINVARDKKLKIFIHRVGKG